jgi:Ca2+-binding EF-hand superfamily protein
LNHFIQKYEECHDVQIQGQEHKDMCEKLFSEMDMNKDGSIDYHELKVFLTRKYDMMFRKQKA